MTSEDDLFHVHGTAGQDRAFQAQLDAIAAQLVVIRELVELLADWAPVRDRVPANEPDAEP